MESLVVIIPTRGRIAKLGKTLNSIPDHPYINIHVVCDGDKQTYEFIANHSRPIHGTLIPEHRGAVYCRNQVMHRWNDGILYATDDIVFHPNAIEHAFQTFNDHFPDDDGVVGFVQEPGEFHPTGVALVGRKFFNRYPMGEMFFPNYFHFACQEVLWLCEALGNKLVQDPHAIIEHRHPCKFREELDQTHRDARVYRKKDHDLITERKNQGQIWGLE